MELEIEMIENIRAAWEQHASDCDREPQAILMNPGNYELIGWDEVFGLPVLPDDRVDPKRFRILCDVGIGGFCADGQVFWDEEGNSYLVVAPEADQRMTSEKSS